MSVFEDLLEVHYNATRHDDVQTVTGPASIGTIREALDTFETSNERADATIVADTPTAAEMERGWITRTDAIGTRFEEFAPIDGVVTCTTQLGQPAGLILRSDAVDLDMEILEPDGVVAIDFERGESR